MMLSEALAVLASFYAHLRLPSGRVIPLPPEPERDGAADFGLEPRDEGLCLVNCRTGHVIGVALEFEPDAPRAASLAALEHETEVA